MANRSSAGSKASDDTPALLGEDIMGESYKNLLNLLGTIYKQAEPSHTPKLLLAFDEAHELSRSKFGWLPSHLFCRVIRAHSGLKDASVWAVLASTVSRIADFAAPRTIREFIMAV